MTGRESTRRWCHLTPTRFFVGMLVVQALLLLSERFRWFAFNEKKGWTVLIAVGVVCVAVLVMLIWTLVCLCFRWRFQFGVRSLLLFLVVSSVPLGWFAWQMQRAKRQRAAVQSITERGVTVIYDVDWKGIAAGSEPPPSWLQGLLGEDFFWDVGHVECDVVALNDDDARHLQELTNLKTLDLTDTQITDKGLEHLKGMTKLEALFLDNTQITDKGLAHLKDMTELDFLYLQGTQITDNGLPHLNGMTNLQALDLSGTRVTDAGLAHLKGLTKLEELYLWDTEVTEAGLEHLNGLNLSRLGLSYSRVSDEDVRKFQQAFPDCRIVH